MKKIKKVLSVKNTFNVSVKQCCTSCLHKCIDNEGGRTCEVVPLKVKPGFGCPSWAMSEGLQRAGASRGRVKKKAYLTYVLLARAEESEAIQRGIITELSRRSIETLREEYEREFGSIYDIL